MKTTYSFLLIVIFATAVVGGETNHLFVNLVPNCVVSVSSSNMLVWFQSPHENNADFPSDREIAFGFQSTATHNYQVFMLRPEYGYRFFATAENGAIVEPTALGRQYGSKFGTAHGFDSEVVGMTHDYNHNKYYWTYAPTLVPALDQLLPAADKLFRFNKPGRYTMRVTLECLCRPGPQPPMNSYPSNFCLVKFPTVTLTVVK